MKQFFLRYSVAFIILCMCTSFIYGVFDKKCGIRGYVYEVKGNQMPSPDEPRTPPRGIRTEVLIYELTGQAEVVGTDRPGFYKEIKTRLVKKTRTNEKGYFQVFLRPGTYSVFTKVDSSFYANLFDQNNKIYPVEVEYKKMTDVVIKQDHNAAY